MKKIFASRGLWISYIAGMTVVFLVTSGCLLLGIKEVFGGFVVVAVGLASKKIIKKRLAGLGEQGIAFYHTPAAYAVAGIFVGLAALSWMFNIFYQGDWFDFTDLGFGLISLPISYLIKFEYDNDRIISRLTLYGLVVLNFFIVTYAVDLVAYLVNKVINSFKK